MSSISVGMLAKRSGVKVSALHFYEEKGLISSWRSPGNQRRYDRSVLRRVAVIKTAQRLGLSLKEISVALEQLSTGKGATKDDWQKLSTQWRSKLDQRISDLTKLRDDLTQCIGCGCLSMEQCPLRNPDDVLSDEGAGPVVWEKKSLAVSHK